MKLLFDQNLSHRLVTDLVNEFPGSVHVREHGLEAASDTVIWSFAAAHDFVIISKDIDFQQRALLFGPPPKVIWIRLGNCTAATVAKLLRSRLPEIEIFGAEAAAAFLAIS